MFFECVLCDFWLFVISSHLATKLQFTQIIMLLCCLLLCAIDGPDNLAPEGPKSVHVGDITVFYCATVAVPSLIVTRLFNGKQTRFHEATYSTSRCRPSALTVGSQTVNLELFKVCSKTRNIGTNVLFKEAD